MNKIKNKTTKTKTYNGAVMAARQRRWYGRWERGLRGEWSACRRCTRARPAPTHPPHPPAKITTVTNIMFMMFFLGRCLPFLQSGQTTAKNVPKQIKVA